MIFTAHACIACGHIPGHVPRVCTVVLHFLLVIIFNFDPIAALEFLLL